MRHGIMMYPNEGSCRCQLVHVGGRARLSAHANAVKSEGWQDATALAVEKRRLSAEMSAARAARHAELAKTKAAPN